MANKKEICPCCGLGRIPEDSPVYECPRCGKEGFDCCVPGTNVLCWECDDMEQEED